MYKNPVLNALTNEDGYLDREKVIFSVPDHVGSEYETAEERYSEKEEFILTSLSLQSLDESFIVKYMDKMDLHDIFKFNKIPAQHMTLNMIDRILRAVFNMDDVELLRWVLEKDYSSDIITQIITKCSTSNLKTPEVAEVIYDNLKKVSKDVLMLLVEHGHLHILDVALKREDITSDDIIKYAGTQFSIDDLIQTFWNATGDETFLDTFNLSKNAPGSLRFYEVLTRLVK